MDMLEGIMMEFMEGRSEELGRKNVIKGLSGEGIMMEFMEGRSEELGRKEECY